MTREIAAVSQASLPILQSPGGRVLLRAVTLRDAAELVALHRVSRAHLQQWSPPTLTVAGFRKNFRQWTKLGSIKFAVCLREDGRIVGEVAMSQVFLGRLKSAYMGYSIGAPYAGQGYMREGVELALRYAFRTLKLNRIEANIQPSNRRSTALAQRLGFALEGYSRRYLKIANGWRDHQRWALLAAEWKPGRKPRPAAETNNDGIEIRDLGLHDIAAFAILRHQISVEGNFMLPEPAEARAGKEKFAERIAHALTDPSRKRILALDGRRVVGFVSGTRGESNRGKHGAHVAIGIARAYTGRGIGKRLMDALEAWARNGGVMRLDLRVMVHNAAAIALYLRCGFSIEGRMRGEYCIDGKLFDAYVMGKILD